MRILASFVVLLVVGSFLFTQSHDALSAPDDVTAADAAAIESGDASAEASANADSCDNDERFHAGLCAENPSWCNDNAGLRNNNPGNIRVKENINWIGEDNSCSSSAFECWEIPELGMRAAYRNQWTYEKRGLETISQRINEWAPDTENDTAEYIRFVSQSMNYDANTPFSIKDEKLGPAFIRAMTNKEVGWKDDKVGNVFYSDQQVLNGFELAFDFDPSNEQDIQARALEMSCHTKGKYTGAIESNPTETQTGPSSGGSIPQSAGDPISAYNPQDESLLGNSGSGDTGSTGSGDTGSTGGGDTGSTGSGDTGSTGGGDTGNTGGDTLDGGSGDVDGDGIPNGEDDDVDGDGIPNENDDDVDGDGIKNEDDDDVDGDGIKNEDDDNDSEGATACEETALFNEDCTTKVTIDDDANTITFDKDDGDTTYQIEDDGTFTDTETDEIFTWDELVAREELTDEEAEILREYVYEGTDPTPPQVLYADPVEGDAPLSVHFNALTCSEGFSSDEEGEILLRLDYGDDTEADALCNTVADDFENSTSTYSFSETHEYIEDGTYEAKLYNIATGDVYGTAEIMVGDGNNQNFYEVVDPDDIDGDGIPNKKDDDVDGDGIKNGEDDDVDGDGVPNSEDDDIDGDGLGNAVDNDVDGDGVKNRKDDDVDGDGIKNEDDTDDDGDGVDDVDESSAVTDLLNELFDFGSETGAGNDSGSSNPLSSLGDIGSMLGQMLGSSGGLGDILGGSLGDLLGGTTSTGTGTGTTGTGTGTGTGGTVSDTTGGTTGESKCRLYDDIDSIPEIKPSSEEELLALMKKSGTLDLAPLIGALKGGFVPAALQEDNWKELPGTGEPLLTTSSDFSIAGQVIPMSTGEGDLIAQLTDSQLPSIDTIKALIVAKEKLTPFVAAEVPTSSRVPVSVMDSEKGRRNACVGASCPLEYGQMKTIHYDKSRSKPLDIWGGLYASGGQVEPGNTNHDACYADYSQGLRLIRSADKDSASDVQEDKITKPLEQ
jgi:hypothetical protein